MTTDFTCRHIGPSQAEQKEMLAELGLASLQELIVDVVPKNIISDKFNLEKLPEGSLSETQLFARLKEYADATPEYHSMAGNGFHPCEMPAVIRRGVLEDSSWYSAYTPYQSEISQGRLEMLMNFQQLVQDFTGLECSNASLLDEASAAAEVMSLFLRGKSSGNKRMFFASDQLSAPILDVLYNRARIIGIELKVGSYQQFESCSPGCYGSLFPYFDKLGNLMPLRQATEIAKSQSVSIAAQVDLLALSLVNSPGSFDFDVAIGSSQRFGVPMAGGGPHASFIAAKMQWMRMLPGRIIGMSTDAKGRIAYRMALQTREQHIRRERATSNICTAQALPANLAAAWAVYHGPEGIRQIASDIVAKKLLLKELLQRNNIDTLTHTGFDTLAIVAPARVFSALKDQGILTHLEEGKIVVSINQLTTTNHLHTIVRCLVQSGSEIKSDTHHQSDQRVLDEQNGQFPEESRDVDYLSHPVFNRHHSENNMMRYLKRLANKDLALNSSMISLGSCTMKLNAAAIMEPISQASVTEIHPMALQESMLQPIAKDLEKWLAELTGFDSVSLQPNAGSQGELAGLIAIQKYQQSCNQGHRDICLIPSSAHGTNPASASLTGLKVKLVKCDEHGNVSLDHLKLTLNEIGGQVSSVMITYPSTHGIFEEDFNAICDEVHRAGGMVYLDGANFNAMMGLVQPRYLGADVCHLNLHKTFCIPHGGGGPGVGPVCAIDKLTPFLPTHRWSDRTKAVVNPADLCALTMAPLGNAGVLPISWGYIMLMGFEGLRQCAQVAILNANYIANRISKFFPILYSNKKGRVAHECIVDLREITKQTKVTAEDVAKRLIDFGFHSPTMSFPVPGTLMIEPTESEDRTELNKFCSALEMIAAEIEQVKSAEIELKLSPLRNAPHTSEDLLQSDWDKPYDRLTAAFPGKWQQVANKYWPVVSRIDNVAGDRNLQCSCPPIEAYEDAI